MIDNLGNVWPNIKDGKLKLLGATTEAHSRTARTCPHNSETVPGFVYTELVRIRRPPKTPPAIAATVSHRRWPRC